MNRTLAGVSVAAFVVGLAGAATPASAQVVEQTVAPGQAPAVAPDTDRVVVTGSLIKGTPEDAALPVEVYSQEELENQGAPTALEFAKSLTMAGPTSGESYYFGGSALAGSIVYNLRGIGADKTLTLLNGRRMAENTASIPSAALARTEILKDGAAVTYGADAVGGVVNFITRDRFNGLEASAQYKAIDSTDGDYGVSILGGVGEGDVNFLWSAEYEHRSRLDVLDRAFSYDGLDPTKPGYNRAAWTTLTGLAGWTARGPLPATPSVANEFGAAVGFASDFTPASCAAVGGRYDNTFTCAMDHVQYYRLVENTDTYRAYAQLNAAISDTMDFHIDASYGQVKVPQVMGSPTLPMAQGPAMATGAVNQIYVPITNPYAAVFAAQKGLAAASGFTPTTYRPLSHGGNPWSANGDGFGLPDEIDNQVWRVSASVSGELGAWAGPARDVSYDFALTYNQSALFSTHPDTIVYRLQEALNGFGGPACNAPDLDPTRFGTQNPALAGKGNCYWWNPFASSFASNPVQNLANPSYIPGSENREDVFRWMIDQRAEEQMTHSVTADLVFSGESPLQLPGGKIGWALGAQARQFESRETVQSPFHNGSIRCAWPTNFTSTNGAGTITLPQTPLATNDPNYRGCTADGPGPFSLFAPNPPDYADQQQSSIFGELKIPVLDNLNLQAAVRHEEFSGGLGATVYKVSGKWDVWGPLSLRASYGTNYQAPPVDIIPGEVFNTARSYTIAAGNWLGAQFITDIDLEAATAESWNTGLIWQSQGFAADHDFRFILDYFNIETQDEIGQVADPNQIANLVFNGPGGTTTTCDPNVQPLLRRVTFNGACTVGMSAVGSFSSISTQFGNGAGQSTSGIDIQVNYDLPVGPGDLSLAFQATQVMELKTGATTLDGVTISNGDDRLGFLNFATTASAAPEWRANVSANYGMNRHNFRLGVNYVSAVTDERAGVQYGEFGEEWITADFTYLFTLSEDLRLTATIGNILDRMPPPAQEEFGYDPLLGNPLGRTFELGVKKTF
jgi:iron complex outermembrane receptor protein